MVETDSPYLAPVPHRGKRNQPAWVTHVGEAVAAAKGVTVDEVEAATWATAAAFYDLDAPIERVCTVEVPIPYAKHLEDAAIPQVAEIVEAAKRSMGSD